METPKLTDDRLRGLSNDLLAIGACARAWEGEARLLGNIRADTIFDACRDALAVIEELQIIRNENCAND
jgi:hypothetical protein